MIKVCKRRFENMWRAGKPFLFWCRRTRVIGVFRSQRTDFTITGDKHLNKSQKTSVGIASAMVVWLLSGDMLTQQADADDMAVDFAPELQLDVTVAVRG